MPVTNKQKSTPLSNLVSQIYFLFFYFQPIKALSFKPWRHPLCVSPTKFACCGGISKAFPLSLVFLCLESVGSVLGRLWTPWKSASCSATWFFVLFLNNFRFCSFPKKTFSLDTPWIPLLHSEFEHLSLSVQEEDDTLCAKMGVRNCWRFSWIFSRTFEASSHPLFSFVSYRNKP